MNEACRMGLEMAELESVDGGEGAAMLTADGVSAEVVALFVRIAQLLGQPRSVGEIYGYLFISEHPRSMQDIMEAMGLSKGSVSQGLRVLRTLGAVRLEFVPGKRSDHFVAENRLKVVAAGYLRNEVEPHLLSGKDRLERIRDTLAEHPDGGGHLAARVAQLRKWHARASQALPLVERILK